MLELGRSVRPDRGCCAYVDTDSLLYWTTGGEDDFDDCLLESERERFEARRHAIFARPDAPDGECPFGLLKLEGHFSEGHFRGIKCYRLWREALLAAYVRCKAVGKLARERMGREDFAVTDAEQLFVHERRLRPTVAGSVHIVASRRRLSTAVNFKRCVPDVSERQTERRRSLAPLTARLPLLLQDDRVHSDPLWVQ